MVVPNWRLLEKVFTAEVLMTPASELVTWDTETDFSEVASTSGYDRYDIVPVREAGRIAGVRAKGDTEVHSLTREWLISADTSVPALIDLFIETGKPGYLVLHEQEIVGLVTPADLNKIPARSFFYLLIGELEMALANWISARIPSGNELLSHLGDEAAEKYAKKLDQLREGNADVRLTELLLLSDLLTIVEEDEALYTFLGYPSKKQAKKDLGGLNDLRNSTMHAARTLVGEVPEDLKKLQGRVRRAEWLLDQLTSMEV